MLRKPSASRIACAIAAAGFAIGLVGCAPEGTSVKGQAPATASNPNGMNAPPPPDAVKPDTGIINTAGKQTGK